MRIVNFVCLQWMVWKYVLNDVDVNSLNLKSQLPNKKEKEESTDLVISHCVIYSFAVSVYDLQPCHWIKTSIAVICIYLFLSSFLIIISWLLFSLFNLRGVDI